VAEDRNWFDAVRERAYEHFLRRQQHAFVGNALTDWFTAEEELRREGHHTDHRGPAQASAEMRARAVVDHHGNDFDNPT
jgi:hypothetical protein